MINQKITELINKEIDGTISSREKELLNDHLKNNPEVNTFYQELLETEQLLDRLPDNEPSVSLKQRILNSIDYNLYSNKHKLTFVDHILGYFSTPRRKFVTSFALGLITGFIILATIFYSYSDQTIKENNVIGTMGTSEMNIIELIPVDLSDVSGKIILSESSDKYFLDFNFSAQKNITIQIDFDPKIVSFDNLSIKNPINFNIEKQLGVIKIIGSQISNCSLTIPVNESDNKNINIRVLSGEKIIFQQKLTLKNI